MGILKWSVTVAMSVAVQSYAAPVAHAQTEDRGIAYSSFAQTQPVTPASEASRVLQRSIDVKFDDARVEDALKTIARLANLRISFSEDVYASRQRVTIASARMSVEQALSAVLQRTALQYRLVGADQVLVDARPKSVQPGTIAGKVTHARTRQPLAGVRIVLDDGKTTVVTADDGTFRLNAPAGEQRLSVRGVGFTRQERKVVVPAGETLTIEITLEPSASVLDEVIVTGTAIATERRAIANPITVITAGDIERRGVTRIEQLLRGEVPGVVAMEQGARAYSDVLGGMETARVYSRGSSNIGGGNSVNLNSASAIKTYVDGVELVDASYLGAIDPASIERIEIITGPQAATIYGSGAMGGVMQIFTKKGKAQTATEVTLSLRYGILQSNLSRGLTPSHQDMAQVAGGDPVFSYTGTLSYNYSGQWQPDLFSRRAGASVGVTLTREKISASGSVATTGGKNGTASIPSNYLIYDKSPAARRLRASGEWEPSTTSLQLTQKTSTSSNQMVSLSLNARPLPQWQHQMVIGRSSNEFQLIPLAPVWSQPRDSLYQTQSGSGARTTASYSTTLSVQTHRWSQMLSLGMNGSWGKQMNVSSCLASPSQSSHIPCTSGGSIAVSMPLSSESGGAFGTWRLGVLDRLFVTLGLRGERNPDYGREHKIDWTPTNGATYTLSYRDVTMKLMASYGSATRAPSAEMREAQLTVWPGYTPSMFPFNVANATLQPEKERGPQGGVEIYYGNLGSLTLNRYRQRTTNLLQLVTVDTLELLSPTGTVAQALVFQWQNTATIAKHGWEAVGSVNAGPLVLKGTWSWNDSRVLYSNPLKLGDASTYSSGEMFRGVPTHTAHVSATYARGSTSVLWMTNIIGKTIERGGGSQLAEMASASNMRLKMYSYVMRVPTVGYTKTGYMKSDLVVSHRVSRSLSLHMNMANLGNSFAADVTGSSGHAAYHTPALGRVTTLGASWRFPTSQ